MANCHGKGKHDVVCNGLLYQCVKCRKIGCDQSVAGRCSNHAFTFGRCNACGDGRRVIAQVNEKF